MVFRKSALLRIANPYIPKEDTCIEALRRRAHHHELCIGKFDAHGPTLPLVPEARSIRAPHRDEPRIGRSRRGWVTRASRAQRLTATQCSTPSGKPVLSAQGTRFVVNECDESAGLPFPDRRGFRTRSTPLSWRGKCGTGFSTCGAES